MKIRNVIVLLCAGMMLSACAEQCGHKEETISGIKEGIGDHSFSEDGNLKFECTPEQIEAEQVYIITMRSSASKSCDESTKQELKKYIDLLFGTDVSVKDMEYSFDLTEQELETGEIDSSIGRFNISVDLNASPGGSLFASNNTFIASDFHEYEYGGDKGFKTGTMYLPDALPEKSFNMFDGSSMTVSDAVLQSEEYISKIASLFNEDSSYRLKRVYVEDYPDKGAVFDLRFEHIFSGLPVNDAGFDLIRDGVKYVNAPYIEVKLLGNHYLGRINNSHYDIIEQKETVDKLITAKEAERLAAENIAPNITGTVKEVSLEYVCVTEQREEKHIYRPMWCFTLDDYLPKLDSMELFPRRMIFVDAVSGMTYYSDHSSYLFALQE